MSDLLTAFGQRIRDLRQANALTQEQLAERCDVSVETISNIERGLHGPRLQLINKLAIALDVPILSVYDFWCVPSCTVTGLIWYILTRYEQVARFSL